MTIYEEFYKLMNDKTQIKFVFAVMLAKGIKSQKYVMNFYIKSDNVPDGFKEELRAIAIFHLKEQNKEINEMVVKYEIVK